MTFKLENPIKPTKVAYTTRGRGWRILRMVRLRILPMGEGGAYTTKDSRVFVYCNSGPDKQC